jgi:Flp pilus assembly protein TadD
MAQIIKFPAQASKFGYKRVKKRGSCAEHPGQLQLFARPTATILPFNPGVGAFEQALRLDERSDARAEDLYRQAIDEQDCPADAYCNLGIIQSKHGHVAQAFDSFTTALKENPRHFEAHYNLGNMYFDVGDHRLAQVHYQIAAEIDATFPNLYFNLALVLAINNELAAAVRAVTNYQSLVPANEARKADELLVNLRKSLAYADAIPSSSAR